MKKLFILICCLFLTGLAQDNAKTFYKQGLKEYRQKHYKRADYYFKKSLRINDKNPAVLYAFALSSFRLGNMKAARSACTRILKLKNAPAVMKTKTRSLLERISMTLKESSQANLLTANQKTGEDIQVTKNLATKKEELQRLETEIETKKVELKKLNREVNIGTAEEVAEKHGNADEEGEDSFKKKHAIRIYSGYGFGFDESDRYEIDYLGTNNHERKGIYYSYGQGINFILDFVIGFNSHLGIVFGGGYILGTDKVTSYYAVETSTNVFNIINQSTMFMHHYVPINLGLQVQSGRRINTWAGAGATLGVAGMAKEEDFSHFPSVSTNTEQTQLKFYPGVGIWGAFGIDFGITKNFALSLCVRGSYLPLRLRKTIKIKDETNGVNNLTGATIKSKETIYKKWKPGIPNAVNGPSDDNQPDYGGHSPKYSFSSLSVLFALTFRF